MPADSAGAVTGAGESKGKGAGARMYLGADAGGSDAPVPRGQAGASFSWNVEGIVDEALVLLNTQLATLVLTLDIRSVGVVAVQHGAGGLPDHLPGPPASPDPPACIFLPTLLALSMALLRTGTLTLVSKTFTFLR